MSPNSTLSMEFQRLAQRIMASAQAHHHAAEHCSVEPNTKSASVGDVFLHIIAIELTLLSIEQCLRLLCLLYNKKTPPSANHDIWSLYNKMLRECDDSGNMRNQIVYVMNTIRKTKTIDSFSVKEVQAFLKKYKLAYSDIRYFLAKKDGTIKPEFAICFREKEIMTFLSLALIAISIVEMMQQNLEMADPLELKILS